MSHVWGGSMRFDSWSRGCCFFFSFALYVPRPQLQWCASTGCIERILFSSFLFVCIARFSKHIFAFPFNWRFLCFAVAFPPTTCVCVCFFPFHLCFTFASTTCCHCATVQLARVDSCCRDFCCFYGFQTGPSPAMQNMVQNFDCV